MEQELEALLKTKSLRVTRPRIAVLEVIQELPHLDATNIVSEVRKKLGTVSTQTVYDVLGTLVESRLARRIAIPNGGTRYEIDTGDNHQHVVCRECGTIHDVADPGTTPASPASDSHGFEIDKVEVTFWGLCPNCRSRRLQEQTPQI